MKTLVLEKTRYILTNSWLGVLLNQATERAADKPSANVRQHPAESRISRTPGSKVKP